MESTHDPDSVTGRQELTIDTGGGLRQVVVEQLSNGRTTVRVDGRMVTRPLSTAETERRFTLDGTEWKILRGMDGTFSLHRQVSPALEAAGRVAEKTVTMLAGLVEAGEAVDWHADVRVPDEWRARVPEWINRTNAAAFALVALPLLLFLGSFATATFVKVKSDNTLEMVLEIEGYSASPWVDSARGMIRVVCVTLLIVGTLAAVMPVGLAVRLAGRQEGLWMIERSAVLAAAVTLGGAFVAGARLLRLLAMVRLPIEPIPGVFQFTGAFVIGVILLLLAGIVISKRILEHDVESRHFSAISDRPIER